MKSLSNCSRLEFSGCDPLTLWRVADCCKVYKGMVNFARPLRGVLAECSALFLGPRPSGPSVDKPMNSACLSYEESKWSCALTVILIFLKTDRAYAFCLGQTQPLRSFSYRKLFHV